MSARTTATARALGAPGALGALGALGVCACATLGGCYQAITAGYHHRFAEEGGPGFEGRYRLAIGEVIDNGDEPAATLEVAIAGGSWGMRAADIIGVMVPGEVADDVLAFFRPGLSFVVLGAEAGDDDVWIGIGAEAEVGFVFTIGDDMMIELGTRGGGDLSYTGEGSGAFFGAFLGIGWQSDGPDFYTH